MQVLLIVARFCEIHEELFVTANQVNKVLGLRVWEGVIRAFVNCFFRAKRRCIHTPLAADFKEARTVLQ